MPLGHHNLLAGWLVMTVPLALARLDEPGVPRWWAGLAGGTGVAVILATGSLTALAALMRIERHKQDLPSRREYAQLPGA